MTNNYRFLRATGLVASVLAAALVVAGCSSSSSSSTTAASTSAAPAQQLTVAYEADSASLDPGQVTDINTMNVLVQLYDTLVKWDVGGNLVPSLATKWEISPDGKKYTFTLRSDVKFSDGTPLTANDVAYSFNRMLVDKAPGSEFGPYPFGKFFFGSIANVQAPDATTAVFNLSTPNGGLLPALTTPTAEIVNSAAAQKAGKDFSQVGGGSGPFMLDNWQKGTQLVLKQNPNYWGTKPTLQQITWVPVADASQRVTNIESGTAGLAINPQPASVPKLQNEGYTIDAATGPHVWWIGLNTSKGPLSNVKVRQAMNYAIDKEAIVNSVLYGTAAASNQPIGDGQPGSATGTNPYTYDVAKAKDLMKQAGFANGFSVNLFVTTSGSGMQEPVAMGTAIQGYLAAIGIKVKIQEFDWGTFLGKLTPGATKSGMDMWELSWMNTSLDPSLILGPLLTKGSWPPGFNTGFYSNPEVDKAVAAAALEKDPAARMALYQKASLLINQDAPWLFIDHGKAVYATNKNVKGLQLNKAMPFLLTELKDASIG
jgi:peptide/nickel transport system substrate-binding protein